MDSSTAGAYRSSYSLADYDNPTAVFTCPFNGLECQQENLLHHSHTIAGNFIFFFCMPHRFFSTFSPFDADFLSYLYTRRRKKTKKIISSSSQMYIHLPLFQGLLFCWNTLSPYLDLSRKENSSQSSVGVLSLPLTPQRRHSSYLQRIQKPAVSEDLHAIRSRC